jgi:hypothetical protein
MQANKTGSNMSFDFDCLYTYITYQRALRVVSVPKLSRIITASSKRFHSPSVLGEPQHTLVFLVISAESVTPPFLVSSKTSWMLSLQTVLKGSLQMAKFTRSRSRVEEAPGV